MWHITVWPVLDSQHVIASYAEALDPQGQPELILTVTSTSHMPAEVKPGTPDHLHWIAEELLELAHQHM